MNLHCRRVWLPLLCTLPLGGIATEVRSVQATPDAEVTAMKKLERWVGEWKGSGWSEFPGSPRIQFELTERVQKKVGDTVLLVEGLGTTTDARGERVVTHDGLALVYFDARTGRYHWNGHDRGRNAIDVEPTVRDDGLEWSFETDDRKATVRFKIELDARQWRESGEFSADGVHWTQFMAMTLDRRP